MSDAVLAIPGAACDAVGAEGHTGRTGTPERDLIEAAKSDPRAFGRLYRAHWAGVAGYLFRRSGDAALAEDLASETFIAAWRALPRYRHTGVAFRSWLLRIATNLANAEARRARPRRNAERSAGVSERAGSGPDPDSCELVHRAMESLSSDHRSVVSLVHFESLSVAEAAAVLGVREGTVKSRLARARGALRVELERLGALR